jgi:HlyD family secretion protein
MPSKLLRPRIIVPLLAIAAAAGGYAWWQSENSASPAERWRLEAVDKGDVVQVISANGNVNPVTSVNVGTQVSGTLIRLHADYNSRVKEGQLLAELDPALFNAALAQSEASLNSANAGLRLAQTKEARTRSLVGKGFISQAELDTAVKELEAAEAQVELVKAQVARDKTNLRYTVIRSPISGVVVARNVELGQTVAASFNTPTLFQIAKDLAEMQIETSIAEADIGGDEGGAQRALPGGCVPGAVLQGRRETGAPEPHHPVQRGELHGHRERRQRRGQAQARHDGVRAGHRPAARRRAAGAQRSTAFPPAGRPGAA